MRIKNLILTSTIIYMRIKLRARTSTILDISIRNIIYISNIIFIRIKTILVEVIYLNRILLDLLVFMYNINYIFQW